MSSHHGVVRPTLRFRIREFWGLISGFPLGVLFGLLMFWCIEIASNRIWLRTQLVSEQGKGFYSLGQLYARKLNQMRMSESEAKLIAQGFHDWAIRRTEQVSFETYHARLNQLLQARQDEVTLETKKAGEEYLKKYLNSGGQQSLSGLAYRVIEPGSNKKPRLKNWVEVSYTASLIDGRVIDGTTKERPKSEVPLNGIIQGWTEGLQLIGEGGEIELVVPSKLAYGDSGTEGTVPPGATLVFRIKLHRISR